MDNALYSILYNTHKFGPESLPPKFKKVPPSERLSRISNVRQYTKSTSIIHDHLVHKESEKFVLSKQMLYPIIALCHIRPSNILNWNTRDDAEVFKGMLHPTSMYNPHWYHNTSSETYSIMAQVFDTEICVEAGIDLPDLVESFCSECSVCDFDHFNISTNYSVPEQNRTNACKQSCKKRAQAFREILADPNTAKEYQGVELSTFRKIQWSKNLFRECESEIRQPNNDLSDYAKVLRVARSAFIGTVMNSEDPDLRPEIALMLRYWADRWEGKSSDLAKDCYSEINRHVLGQLNKARHFHMWLVMMWHYSRLPSLTMTTCVTTLPGCDVLMEVLGPYQQTSKGHRWLVVCTDIFSLHMTISPVKTLESSALVNMVQNLFINGGRKLSNLFINGPYTYYNKEFTNLIQTFVVDNEVSYRAMDIMNYSSKFLDTIIRIYIKSGDFEWDDVVTPVVMTYNMVSHPCASWVPFIMYCAQFVLKDVNLYGDTSSCIDQYEDTSSASPGSCYSSSYISSGDEEKKPRGERVQFILPEDYDDYRILAPNLGACFNHE